MLPCVDNDAAEQVVIPAPGWLNEARGAAADDRGEELATRTAAVVDAPAGACDVAARVRPMASARRRAPDMTSANGQFFALTEKSRFYPRRRRTYERCSRRSRHSISRGCRFPRGWDSVW